MFAVTAIADIYAWLVTVRYVPIASLIARTQKTERQFLAVLAPRRINDPLLVYL